MKQINHYFSCFLTLASIINFSIFTLGINYVENEINSKNENPNSFVIESVQTCEIADNCIDIAAAQTLTTAPTEENCGPFVLNSISGCLDMATPETILNDCGFNVNPTVWFKINTDANAVQLYTYISTSGNWDPVWAIYGGDCNNLELIPGGTIAQPTRCSNDDVTPDAHNVNIPLAPDGNVIRTMYIAVSGVGVLDDPNFTLSAFTQGACVSCIGDDCGQPLATFEIIERSSDRALDDLEFCQGEDVRLCINFFYDPSETGIDWFHGLMPDFGSGWDMNSFDPTNITVSPEGAEFLGPGDGECAPIITETMPYLCSYTDETGRLRLCNVLCGNCPCQAPLVEGSPLPYGWFWSTNGGAGCENTCSPSSRYGIPGSQSGLNVIICMNLRTRVFNSPDECNANKNLQIKFVTTSDGVSGCWDDPVAECLLDVAQVGPLWALDCTPIVVVEAIVEEEVICNNDILKIQLNTSDGSETPIVVEPIPNPNVTGTKSYTYNNGSGIVEDTLINLTTATQIVHYLVRTESNDQICSFGNDTISISIVGIMEISFDDIYNCVTDCVELIPLINSEYPIVNYVWTNGDTTESSLVCPEGLVVYSVSITNDKGCTAIGSVQTEQKPAISFDIFPDTIFIYQDSSAVDVEVEINNIITNGSNYNIEWVVPEGLEGEIIDSTNKFVINHETSRSNKNSYSLCATLIDEDGCSITRCIPVHVSRPQDSILCTAWVADLAREFQSDSLYNCTDYGYFEIRRSILEGVEYIVFYGYNGTFGLAKNWKGRTYTLDGVLIHAFDSDVNNGECNPCQELAFEADNNIYRCQEEYPMCCSLEISGFVFSDNPEMPNGIFDPGENPIGLIEVELWTVSGHGCSSPLDTLVSSYTTNGITEYTFTGLRPGTYRVRIAPEMVNINGPLVRFTASTPIEYCIVVECDSNTILDEYNFGFYYECSISMLQHHNCQIASENPVICNLEILETFCGQMFSTPSPEPKLVVLCPDGGQSDNNSWFAFVAGEGDYNIVITPFDCIDVNGSIGFQAGIYTDCSFVEAVFCHPACTTNPISIPSSLLQPGEVYYLFLDGCVGSYCNYEIDITGSYSPYEMPTPTGISVHIDGCDPICVAQNAQFTLEGLDREMNYAWSVIDSSGLEPVDMVFFSGWPMTTQNTMTLAFPRAGVYTVCMEAASFGCEVKGPFCTELIVVENKDEDFIYEVCTTDFPWVSALDESGEPILDVYGNPIVWAEGNITLEMVRSGVSQFESEYLDDCGCSYSQIINITELVVGSPCDDGDPETINDVLQDDCTCKGEIDVQTTEIPSIKPYYIFPNPTTGMIVVKGDVRNIRQHHIVNVDGQQKKYNYKLIEGDLEIDLSDFTPGIYILKIEDGQKNHFVKIIKI